MGIGMNGSVKCVAAVDGAGNLYAGGSFTFAGGVPANYIAEWNGSSWSALGGGMDNTVNALAVDGAGNLYAGGDFIYAGGTTANYVAVWNGTSWSPVGSGLDNSVSALAIDRGGNVYAGGFLPVLSYYSGATCSVILMLPSITESAGVHLADVGHIASLAVDSAGNLYAGGNLVMAEWNGSTWVSLGSGISGPLGPFVPPYFNALAVDNSGTLYAAG